MEAQMDRSVHWMDYAACCGESLIVFFGPNRQESKVEREQRVSEAKVVCASCLVRRQCLDEAIRDRLRGGIWGGLTAAERAVEKRRRRRAGMRAS